MSFISMLSRPLVMNVMDYDLKRGAILIGQVVAAMLTVGFITPWSYNYMRLKKLNQAASKL